LVVSLTSTHRQEPCNWYNPSKISKRPKPRQKEKRKKKKEKRLGMFGKTQKLNLVPWSNAFGIKNIKFD
jgi:hypothetical protein